MVLDVLNFICRLQENIEPAPENQLSLDEICKAVDTCKSPAIGRIIQKVFPNVVVQKKRCKDDWTTKVVIYQGISWRPRVYIPANIDFKDISHFSKDFFVMNETAYSVTLGHILNFMINFNKVIIEIHFQRNLQWFVSLCGRTEIKPQQFGMNNCFKLETNSIAGILDGIRTLRVCQGIDSEHKFSSDYKDDIIKEIFTTLKEENSTRTVFRLLNCNRVLNFRTHLSVNICLVCKGALEKKQSDSYKTDMTDPSMSNIPIDHSYIGYKKARKSNVENICDNSKSDHEGTCKRPLADITNTIDISACQAKPSSSRLDHNYIVKRKAQKSDVDKKCESSKCEGTAEGPQLADIKNVNDKSSSCQAKPSKTSFPNDHHDHTSDSNTHIQVTLTEADNSDMEVIFNEVSKDCPPKILEFLMSQKKALSSHPNGRRWDTNIIRLCLTLWCRSPKCYADLRESGFLVLPSQKLLQIYKNKIHQKAGLNKELLHWMKNEAMHKNIPPEGYEGGLILDEMSIQSDLQFYSKNGGKYLVGFTDISDESRFMDEINSGKREIFLATHVLQYVFLGFTGFRFPLFHFPTKQATASELNVLFWKIINLLLTLK